MPRGASSATSTLAWQKELMVWFTQMLGRQPCGQHFRERVEDDLKSKDSGTAWYFGVGTSKDAKPLVDKFLNSISSFASHESPEAAVVCLP